MSTWPDTVSLSELFHRLLLILNEADKSRDTEAKQRSRRMGNQINGLSDAELPSRAKGELQSSDNSLVPMAIHQKYSHIFPIFTLETWQQTQVQYMLVTETHLRRAF